MKYVLKKPIDAVGGTISELTFREAVVAGDMRGVAIRDPMFWDDILKIAGRLCGQPDAVINALSFADLSEVTTLVVGFMNGPAGPMTGKTG